MVFGAPIATQQAVVTNESSSEKTNQTEKPGKRSGKKVAFLGLGLLLLLGAGGGIGWHYWSHAAAVAKPPSPPPISIVHLDHFIVNLADTNQDAYLRVGIDLGVDAKPRKKPASRGQNAMPTPEIRDAIISVLTTYHSSDLLTPQGKTQLKQNLLEALNRGVPGLKVHRIYFTDFLVQR